MSMSNSDFEDRLSRIKANAEQRAEQRPGGAVKTRIRHGRFALGCLMFAIGLQLIKVATTNYDSIRDQHGIAAAAGLGLGCFAVLILAGVLVFSSVRPRNCAPSYPVSGAYAIAESKAQVKTPAAARLFFSLVGLALGGLACFFMYVGNAGRQMGVTGQIDPQTAQAMAMGSTIAAFLLVAVGLLIGFVGLFVRGLPMRRVPIFLVLGAMLLYTSFQTLRIHPSNWPTFMAEFTRSFTNQMDR